MQIELVTLFMIMSNDYEKFFGEFQFGQLKGRNSRILPQLWISMSKTVMYYLNTITLYIFQKKTYRNPPYRNEI